MFIDTHCHFNHEQFSEDLEPAIDRAIAAGVERMFVVGFDQESSEAAINLSERFSSLYAAIGIHPHDAKSYSSSSEMHLRDLAGHPRVAAIGEIGLDYHYDFSPVAEQKSAFRAQLSLAEEL